MTAEKDNASGKLLLEIPLPPPPPDSRRRSIISNNPRAFTGAFLSFDWDHACRTELYVVASGRKLVRPLFAWRVIRSSSATARLACPQLLQALMTMLYEYTSGLISSEDVPPTPPPPPPDRRRRRLESDNSSRSFNISSAS